MMNPAGRLIGLTTILAISASMIAPTAAADQRHHPNDTYRYERDHRDNRRDARNDHRRDHREYRRDDKRRDRYDPYYERQWSRADRYYDNHHHAHQPTQVFVTRNVYRTPYVQYNPRWHVGERYHYSPHTVVIRNPHHYGLYAPPHGHHWVRDDDRGDAILASVATGAIIGLVIGVIATN